MFPVIIFRQDIRAEIVCKRGRIGRIAAEIGPSPRVPSVRPLSGDIPEYPVIRTQPQMPERVALGHVNACHIQKMISGEAAEAEMPTFKRPTDIVSGNYFRAARPCAYPNGAVGIFINEGDRHSVEHGQRGRIYAYYVFTPPHDIQIPVACGNPEPVSAVRIHADDMVLARGFGDSIQAEIIDMAYFLVTSVADGTYPQDIGPVHIE